MDEISPLFAEVQEVFRSELKLPDLVLRTTDTTADIPKWDSLRSMVILRKLEMKYNVRVGVEKAIGIRSVGDLVAALEAKINHG